MKKIIKNKKGFSLIELIVVIAILGVIAAIAVPAVMNTLKDSKIKSDIQTAQTISKAINTAVVANAASGGSSGADISHVEADLSEYTSLANYVDINKVPQSNPSKTFKVTITDAKTNNPKWTVKFSDGTATHTVNEAGTVTNS